MHTYVMYTYVAVLTNVVPIPSIGRPIEHDSKDGANCPDRYDTENRERKLGCWRQGTGLMKCPANASSTYAESKHEKDVACKERLLYISNADGKTVWHAYDFSSVKSGLR